MEIKMIFLSIVGLALANIATPLELLPYPLPYQLYPARDFVTVSGTESGGFMAQIMHFSHSYLVKGCAIYSATFYRCGPLDGVFDDFLNVCTLIGPNPGPQYPVENAVVDLQSYNSNQLIDSLSNLRYSYVYVYAGLQSAKVSAAQQLYPIALYEHYLDSPYLIKSRVQNTADELRVINPFEPHFCPQMHEIDGTLSSNCTNLSAPTEALEFLMRKYLNYFNNPFVPRFHYVYLELLQTFDQTEFTTDLGDTGLDDVGYFYVPKQCQRNRGRPCLLHIYFHGCNQGREFVGTSHIMGSNYLELAEANNIIMLFPQALSSSVNPLGCWDVNGWTGSLFATKSGVQVQAIWRMVERLLNLPAENPKPYPPPPTYYSQSPPSPYFRAGGGEKKTKTDRLRGGEIKKGEKKQKEVKKEKEIKKQVKNDKEAKKEIKTSKQEVKSGQQEIKKETKSGQQEIKKEIKGGQHEIKKEVKTGQHEIKKEIKAGQEIKSGQQEIKKENKSGQKEIKKDNKNVQQEIKSGQHEMKKEVKTGMRKEIKKGEEIRKENKTPSKVQHGIKMSPGRVARHFPGDFDQFTVHNYTPIPRAVRSGGEFPKGNVSKRCASSTISEASPSCRKPMIFG